MKTETRAEVLENFPRAFGLITNLLYAKPRIPKEHNKAQGPPITVSYTHLTLPTKA